MAAKKSAARKSANPKVKKAVPRRPAAKKASVKMVKKTTKKPVPAVETSPATAAKAPPVQPTKRGPGRPAGSGKGKKGAGRPTAHVAAHWLFALVPVVEDELGLEDDSASTGPVKVEYHGTYDSEEAAIDAAILMMADKTDLRVSLARDYRVGRVEVKRRLI